MRTALARAKVNLFLSVAGRRADGLHNLESLCVFAPIGDVISIRSADKEKNGSRVSIGLSGPYSVDLGRVAMQDNLVMQAAGLLSEIARGRRIDDCNQQIHIELEKNLPLASGLGGGSSDAMTVLYLLNDIWGVGLNDQELMALAFKIGADGPICLWPHLYGRYTAHHDFEDGSFGKDPPDRKDHPEQVPSARFSNAGETVMSGPRLPAFAMVLANPGLSLATKDVFDIYASRASNNAITDNGSYSDNDNGSDQETVSDIYTHRWPSTGRRMKKLDLISKTDIRNFSELIHVLKNYTNDLEEPACICAPAIGELGAMLREMPGCALARMTGSGATCFGLFETFDLAQQAAANLSQFGKIWAVPCRFGVKV